MNNLFRDKKWVITAGAVLILGCIALGIYLKKSSKKKVYDPAYSAYIESYTSGVISKVSAIRIKLASQVQTGHAKNEMIDASVFDFSPSVKGTAYWVDAQTIEFKPSEKLLPNKKYEVEFNLGKVVKVPEKFAKFDFDFETIKPDYTIDFEALRSATKTSTDKMKLNGTVLTADAEDNALVENIVSAQYPGKVTFNWAHDVTGKVHKFTITDIRRTKEENKLTLSWNGTPLDIKGGDTQTFDVPKQGVFKVLDMKVVNEGEQYVLVYFSNPIMVGQELAGLTGINNMADVAYTIDGSTVKLYANALLEGNYMAFVNDGVEDINAVKVLRPYTANLYFENRMPSVTIPGKGVIMPNSGKLKMPFEAVNLKAVDVSIIKVYENNVPQYFQNNGFDGAEQLRQVGIPVVQKTIQLDEDKSLVLTKKNRFMLDIDHLVRTEPGAIYRVVIGFRAGYSLFNCNAPNIKNGVAADGADDDEDEGYGYDEGSYGGVGDDDDEFWSRYDSYYPSGYRWKDKDDPCKDSYYTRDKWAMRNVIASNIGLIAKRGNDNSMTVAVTNILDAAPMSGVDIELLDYQKQVILKTKSDGDGMANFILKRRPYLLVAKNGKERGYLKLDDGNSLPLTKFNVGGEQVQKGLKGFIYGERGVWRPGDSVFLSFMLEDKQRTLPPDHPVEFEFYNPQGQLASRITRNSSVDGIYSFHTATTTTSPTGNWLAKVKVGGAKFEKTVKVETIMPNRLKINLNFGDKDELTRGSSTGGTLSAQWLFGGVAQNLKAKVDAYFSPQTTSFKNFPDYVFDDPTRAFNTQMQTVFDGKLDADGVTPVDANINIDNQAPGQLKANFLVKVFEPGGAFSVYQKSMPYNVYPGYVGINVPKGSAQSGMLTTGSNHNIDIAAVDTKGQLQAGDRDVEVELYKIQWRWWWDRTGDELSNFTQDQYNKLVRTETVRLTEGKGKWALSLTNDEWGRYLIRVKDPMTGHSAGKVIYADWPNWAERMQQGNSTEATMLSFTSNKPSYKVGETGTLTIPTGADGRALISYENGSKVLKTEWIDTRKGQTRYNFKVDPSMAPNVFMTVTLLQHHDQTVNDLPIRMYGAIPIEVEDPETILKPVISMPDKIKPETTASITVSEASGKAMAYTVAIVDEGLLDLTNFKTPDPHPAFYAREALGVKTWDLYDYVMGAFGNGLERILSIGGDGTGLNNRNATVNRFKPVVKFLGPFRLGAGEKQTKSFKLPQYVGSVRAMVVAGYDGKYGFAEKPVAVKKPLMILATLPRVLGPAEKVQLPVDVFAMESNIKTVELEIRSNAFSNLVGNNRKTVTFSKPGDQIVFFDLDVKNMVGIGDVKIIARGGGETAEYDVKLNIRNPNPPITRVIEKELRPGENWQTAYVAVGMAGTNRTSLEVSTIPALNLAKRLEYLIGYPHGCVEQTTSAVFPQLYLSGLMDLDARKKAEIDRNIKAGISRLNGFRVPGGGLSYWPGEGDADEWGSNYAGHFILEAQAKGYSIPAGFIDQWKKFQKQKALTWAPDSRRFYGDDLTQAYRLYLLALAKAPELGAMNRLKEFKYISPDAKWRLAAAYKLAGQTEVAQKMISGLPYTVKPYNQMYGTYGSDVRDQAMILETLTLLGDRGKAMGLLRGIAQKLSRDDWYSTQTTAYSLMAIAKYCGEVKSGNKMAFTYTAGKQNGNINSASYVWQNASLADNGSLSLKNNGGSYMFVRLIQRGQPSGTQLLPTKIDPDVLQMRVGYFTLAGKPLNVASIKQGTDFVAQVNIKNPGKRGRYDNLALTQIFPSGWEILNTRMMNNEEAFRSSASDYRDIKDDRVSTYFSLPEGKEVTYFVMLNAAYTGKYNLPSTYCEAMYDASINAFVKGGKVEVVK
ncbi:alpha-2-macroglobulin family protein [Mucilaginibacter myungsuensis]|uniref:Alpha-2-macroglobulin family protein n=1 Tax=Mucilaginibacter myungsuensis TaxID=649104 RepID=A0A929KY00_9SPHI|nr:MG2 domain-containing protein [Mucilaginibacter myungsuensis]MBE9660690.1 hypothetical protein [Mucilaginibacter myungsuensis]MDN3600735.1 MG2 domain-containing protein [Mucilaginibacter myungsuensis]